MVRRRAQAEFQVSAISSYSFYGMAGVQLCIDPDERIIAAGSSNGGSKCDLKQFVAIFLLGMVGRRCKYTNESLTQVLCTKRGGRARRHGGRDI